MKQKILLGPAILAALEAMPDELTASPASDKEKPRFVPAEGWEAEYHKANTAILQCLTKMLSEARATESAPPFWGRLLAKLRRKK